MLLAFSRPLIQRKEQRIDNSIKFMFIETGPRGLLQPIAARVQS